MTIFLSLIDFLKQLTQSIIIKTTNLENEQDNYGMRSEAK